MAPVIAPVTIRPPVINALDATLRVVEPVIGPDTNKLVVITRAAGIDKAEFVSSVPFDQMSPPVTAPETRSPVAPVIAPVTIRPPAMVALAPVIGPDTSKLVVTTRAAGTAAELVRRVPLE